MFQARLGSFVIRLCHKITLQQIQAQAESEYSNAIGTKVPEEKANCNSFFLFFPSTKIPSSSGMSVQRDSSVTEH